MQFEQATLEQVMAARASVQAARSSGDVKAVGVAEGPLRASVGAIVATAEAYPELRASQNFQQLLSRITGLENAISDRREFYNETANLNNVRIEQFPDVIAARLFGFRPAALLEFDAAEIADVDVRGLFRS
jgi:LemA protein